MIEIPQKVIDFQTALEQAEPQKQVLLRTIRRAMNKHASDRYDVNVNVQAVLDEVQPFMQNQGRQLTYEVGPNGKGYFCLSDPEQRQEAEAAVHV